MSPIRDTRDWLCTIEGEASLKINRLEREKRELIEQANTKDNEINRLRQEMGYAREALDAMGAASE